MATTNWAIETRLAIRNLEEAIKTLRVDGASTKSMRAYRDNLVKERSKLRTALEKMHVTPEEKTRWEPMLHQTWNAIGHDVEVGMRLSRQKLTKAIIVESVLDANRIQMYGDMTDAEYEFLCIASHRDSVRRWLYKVLNY